MIFTSFLKFLPLTNSLINEIVLKNSTVPTFWLYKVSPQFFVTVFEKKKFWIRIRIVKNKNMELHLIN